MKSISVKNIFAAMALLLLPVSQMVAQNFVAVSKTGNVYDEANAKYITVNQNNDDVSVIPGMVFLTTQHTPGWYKVEYSPGLHAFIPEQITASSFKPVAAGTYDIVNNPGHKITAQNTGDNWVATVEGQTYKGVKSEDIIVFFDGNKRLSYSLVDFGNGPIAITYDNAVTKFF